MLVLGIEVGRHMAMISVTISFSTMDRSLVEL